MDPEFKACTGNDIITSFLQTGPRLHISKEKIELENAFIAGPPSVIENAAGSPDGEYLIQFPVSLTRENYTYMADYEYDENGVILAVHFDPVPNPEFGRPQI